MNDGVAVLMADTGYELYAACETITDLDQLYADLGMAGETPDDAMHSVCDQKLPEAGEVWGGVVRLPWNQPAKRPSISITTNGRNIAAVCFIIP